MISRKLISSKIKVNFFVYVLLTYQEARLPKNWTPHTNKLGIGVQNKPDIGV